MGSSGGVESAKPERDGSVLGGARIDELRAAGVAVWIDALSRDALEGGQFKAWITDGGITGATSNPTIFAEALASPSNPYDTELKSLKSSGIVDAKEIFLTLAISDVGAAADLLAETHKRSGGSDGFISIECTPDLADDTDGTVTQGLEIWSRLRRPNILVKVPATDAGVVAVRQLITAGVNINITLLFSQSRYGEVVEAYLSGLEERLALGEDLSAVTSVASFFLSRVDTEVDRQLDEMSELQGQAAISNARLAYQRYKSYFSGTRWDALASAGARPQRLLWASTGTKNPSFSDVRYIEELVGPDIINTMPPKAYEAFADHGETRLSIGEDIPGAENVVVKLAEEGVDLGKVALQLEHEGVAAFCSSYHQLLRTIATKLQVP